MKTIFLTGLETCNLLNVPHKILPNTTLNESLGAGGVIEGNPNLQYFSIGLKTLNLERVNDTLKNLNPNKRNPLNINVRSPIPFVMVPTTSDLTHEERTNYRLRVTRTINGVDYALYYLKKIDLTMNSNYLKVLLDDDGSSKISILKPDLLTANAGDGEVNEYVLDGERRDTEFVAYTKPLKLVLTPLDIVRVTNAVNLLYGSNMSVDSGIIGEMCICSGIEVSDNGITEAFSVQSGIFLDTDIDLEERMTKGVTKIFELGGMELFKSEGI